MRRVHRYAGRTKMPTAPGPACVPITGPASNTSNERSSVAMRSRSRPASVGGELRDARVDHAHARSGGCVGIARGGGDHRLLRARERAHARFFFDPAAVDAQHRHDLDERTDERLRARDAPGAHRVREIGHRRVAAFAFAVVRERREDRGGIGAVAREIGGVHRLQREAARYGRAVDDVDLGIGKLLRGGGGRVDRAREQRHDRQAHDRRGRPRRAARNASSNIAGVGCEVVGSACSARNFVVERFAREIDRIAIALCRRNGRTAARRRCRNALASPGRDRWSNR